MTRDLEAAQDRLVSIIKDVARGIYSDEIMELTKKEYPEVIRDVAEAVGMMMVKIEAREYRLEQLNEQLKANVVKTVTAAANALEARDEYTKGHAVRVAAYAERLARRMGLEKDEVETIRLAGLVHDIGKIGFSDAVFTNVDTKAGDEILTEIRRHPDWGLNILEDLDFLGRALEYMHAHHERMDGKGYPRGLDGRRIPLGARILSVADTFDAITTTRPYQKGRTLEEAVEIMRKVAGTQLDAKLVELFLQEVEEGGLEGVTVVSRLQSEKTSR